MANTPITPNFTGTKWSIKVVQPDIRESGSVVTFNDNGIGTAYFTSSPDDIYNITWSTDTVNTALNWTMPDVIDKHPRNFVNYWPLDYESGPIIMNIGNSSVPLSGTNEYNFTQTQE